MEKVKVILVSLFLKYKLGSKARFIFSSRIWFLKVERFNFLELSWYRWIIL